MERLTDINLNALGNPRYKKCITAECDYDCGSCVFQHEADRKLKEYEDLEEQGLLLRLTKNGLSTLRTEIKNSILHYLCDDWNNHKRGKAHKENQAIFDREEGYAIWNGIDLEMVMEKVVKGIWSVDIEKILTRTEVLRKMEGEVEDD